MVNNPIATFCVCSGELVHSSGPTVTLPTSQTVQNTATVHTTSVINTNTNKHPQLSTAANTVKKSTTGIPKSTLKLNLPLNIKLPTNILPPAKKTILKAPNSIPLKKRVTFENLMATLPLDTTEKTSQSNQIMSNAVNPNTAQTLRVGSASALLKNTDNQINHSIVQSNLVHCTPTSSAQVTENNVTKHVGSNITKLHIKNQLQIIPNHPLHKALMLLSSAMKMKANLTMLLLQKKKNLIFCTNSFPSLNTPGKKLDPW